jgi:hypothetical protein
MPGNAGRRLRRRGAERGQASLEYLGMVTVAALVVIALILAAPAFGGQIAAAIESTICRVIGAGCAGEELVDRCPLETTTRTDSFEVGASVKVFSFGGGLDRVIVKEEFDDGTAIYTVIDRATFQAAIGEDKGGSARFLGTQGSLTAGLAAIGALEGAAIYETEDEEQTREIDERLSDPGFAENVIRAGGGVQDAIVDSPVNSVCGPLEFLPGPDCPDVRPSDILPNPNEIVADMVFGDQDLPDPSSEYVAGEVGVRALAEAIQDQAARPGVDESGASAELEAAGGARIFTRGERQGELEVYYRITGSLQAELEDSLLGTANAGATGEVTATVLIGADGRPRTLRLNATGTLTGDLDLGGSDLISGGDVGELLADRDSREGQSYEVVTELDLSDPTNLIAATGLLGGSGGAQALIDVLRDDAEIRVGVYDHSSEATSSGIDVVVANVGGSRTDERNVLRSLYVKPRGSLGFVKTPCGTDG